MKRGVVLVVGWLIGCLPSGVGWCVIDGDAEGSALFCTVLHCTAHRTAVHAQANGPTGSSTRALDQAGHCSSPFNGGIPLGISAHLSPMMPRSCLALPFQRELPVASGRGVSSYRIVDVVTYHTRVSRSHHQALYRAWSFQTPSLVLLGGGEGGKASLPLKRFQELSFG